MDQEADALVDEFNRIVLTTKFNGQNLLDLSNADMRIQGGYGISGSLATGLGSELAHTTGIGTFGAAATFTITGTGLGWVQSADFNRDGKLDVAYAAAFMDRVAVAFGDGQGSFSTTVTVGKGADPGKVVVGDFDRDGDPDIVASNAGSDDITIVRNNGDGSFASAVTHSAGFDVDDMDTLVAGDFDNDGKLDLAMTGHNDNVIGFLWGDGNGGFSSPDTRAFTSGDAITAGDFNGDSISDLALFSSNTVHILTSNGARGFSDTPSLVIGSASGLKAADLNGDGRDDLVATNTGATPAIGILLNSASGTFSSSVSYAAAAAPRVLQVADLDGDGDIDIVNLGDTANVAQIWSNDGAGAFSNSQTISNVPANGGSITVGDLNNDGAADLVGSGGDNDTIVVMMGTPGSRTTIVRVDLTTQAGALEALSTMEEVQKRIQSEIANVGAQQSRLSTFLSQLSASTVSIDSAAARITDIDVGSEASALARVRILQEVGAAVLAQANLAPSLALQLLR